MSGFVDKTRTGAVHWLDRRSFKAGEVACGHPVEWERGRRNLTDHLDAITCRQCAEIVMALGHTVRGRGKDHGFY